MSNTQYRLRRLGIDDQDAQILAQLLMAGITALNDEPSSPERSGRLRKMRSLLERVHQA